MNLTRNSSKWSRSGLPGRSRLVSWRSSGRRPPCWSAVCCPAGCPTCAGLEFATRYLTPEEPVGGDWYDAFTVPSGDLWVVTGDVAGHGLHAAVVMGRVRSASALLCAALQRPGRGTGAHQPEGPAFRDGDDGDRRLRHRPVPLSRVPDRHRRPSAPATGSGGRAGLLRGACQIGPPLGVQHGDRSLVDPRAAARGSGDGALHRRADRTQGRESRRGHGTGPQRSSVPMAPRACAVSSPERWWSTGSKTMSPSWPSADPQLDPYRSSGQGPDPGRSSIGARTLGSACGGNVGPTVVIQPQLLQADPFLVARKRPTIG